MRGEGREEKGGEGKGDRYGRESLGGQGKGRERGRQRGRGGEI